MEGWVCQRLCRHIWRLAHTWRFGLARHHRFEQGLSLGHQFLAQLIGAPALPAFKFTGSGQSSVHPRIQGRVQVASVFFEYLAQGVGRTRTGFAVTLSDLGFHRSQHRQHRLCRLLTQGLALGGVHLGFGRFGLFFTFSHGSLNRRLAAQGAQFVGPHGHLWQRSAGIFLGTMRLRQSRLKRVPHALQLIARGLQLGRKLHVHTGPSGLLGQPLRLLLPLGHVGL